MRRVWTLMAVAILAVSLGGCGTVTRMGDIAEHPDRYMNTEVTVFGAVSNSETLTPMPGQLVKFHGKYTLTDQDNKPIVVKTVSQPPANGTEQRVTGKLVKSDEDPVNGFVIERTGITWLPAMGGNLPLIGALVVLVALAVVLVYLLVRPPSRRCIHCQRKNPLDAEICRFCGKPVDREVISETKPCPACDYGNPVNALFCESCGASLEEVGPTTPIGPLAELRVVNGSPAMEGKRFDVAYTDRKDTYRIGSSVGMDIRIVGDSTVSREHAAIRCTKENGFFVQDLGSTNGTKVNGKDVVRESLSDGDMIQVGKTNLRFRLP